jgi:hypothetical protein
MARDITLQYGNADAATNPYGVAQVGDRLYIVDYDSQKIYTLGVNEINGLADGESYTLTEAPFDLGPGTAAGLSADAKGQAIIALANGSTNYVYALYTVSNKPSVYQAPGVLVRMRVDKTTGALTYETKVSVGMNPQEIIPVIPTGGTPTLLIPAVGGIQKDGKTNGTASNIVSVPAFAASWSSATYLITGDNSPATNPAYDIHAIAAPLRPDNDGVVYILTLEYAANYAGTDWALYQTTVNNLLTRIGTQISQTPGIARIDSNVGDAAGYFWSILYENGATADNDRLWFFRGAPLLVTPASAYTPPPQSGTANRFFPVGNNRGQIGGVEVDWADLTSETLRQAGAGVSLKRGFRSVIKAPKAAETEEEKK